MPSAEPARHYALVLGSNHRRAQHLRLACRRLRERFAIDAATSALRTRDGGTRYLNAGVVMRSALPLPELRAAVRAIEDEAGREHDVAQVTLDIDIVASRDAAGRIETYKPDDLRRDYVRALLRQIGFAQAL